MLWDDLLPQKALHCNLSEYTECLMTFAMVPALALALPQSAVANIMKRPIYDPIEESLFLTGILHWLVSFT